MCELKEEAIKKAYGNHWQYVERQHKGNGWLTAFGMTCISDFKGEEIEFRESIGGFNTFRLKSLSGIEFNNGWIRIDNEKDLPTESGWYEFQIFPQEKYTPNHSYWNAGNVKVGWFIETYTHYRTIHKPNDPIY